SSPEQEILYSKVLATPATRKLARELGINLTQVEGTGAQGRITKEDVRLAYEGQSAAAPRTSHPAPVTSLVRPERVSSAVIAAGEVQRIPLKGVRKAIAKSMARSKATAAHFTYVEECDMSKLVKLRADH